MRVIVTGATGFVGAVLTERLKASGHTVIAVSRNPASASERLNGIDAVGWDGLVGALEEPTDAVVHLAGETVQGRWNTRKIEEVRSSRLQTTARVIEAIESAPHKPAVLVSASGIGFYGSAKDDELTEVSLPGDDYFARLCVEWEQATFSAPCRSVAMRFGIVIGPEGGALDVMKLPAKMGVSGPLAGGKQWWSWVDIDDAVGAIMHAISHEAISGPVNVVAPQPIRQIDFNRVLCGHLKRPSFMPAPAFALRLVLGTFATEVLSSKRVIPEVLLTSGYEWVRPELADSIANAL